MLNLMVLDYSGSECVNKSLLLLCTTWLPCFARVPSLPPSLPHSLPHSLPPSLPPSLTPSLPPSPSLPTSRLPSSDYLASPGIFAVKSLRIIARIRDIYFSKLYSEIVSPKTPPPGWVGLRGYKMNRFFLGSS